MTAPLSGLWAILLCCAAITLSGCATVTTVIAGATKTADSDGKVTIPWVYCGVATDMYFIRQASEDSGLLVIDLPLSAVADTLVLPFTIWAQDKYGNICEKYVSPGE